MDLKRPWGLLDVDYVAVDLLSVLEKQVRTIKVKKDTVETYVVSLNIRKLLHSDVRAGALDYNTMIFDINLHRATSVSLDGIDSFQEDVFNVCFVIFRKPETIAIIFGNANINKKSRLVVFVLFIWSAKITSKSLLEVSVDALLEAEYLE